MSSHSHRSRATALRRFIAAGWLGLFAMVSGGLPIADAQATHVVAAKVAATGEAVAAEPNAAGVADGCCAMCDLITAGGGLPAPTVAPAALPVVSGQPPQILADRITGASYRADAARAPPAC